MNIQHQQDLNSFVGGKMGRNRGLHLAPSPPHPHQATPRLPLPLQARAIASSPLPVRAEAVAAPLSTLGHGQSLQPPWSWRLQWQSHLQWRSWQGTVTNHPPLPFPLPSLPPLFPSDSPSPPAVNKARGGVKVSASGLAPQV